MKFNLPPYTHYLKALVIAVLIGVAGYFIFPAVESVAGGMRQVYVLSLVAGAFVAASVAAIGVSAGEGELKSIFVGNLAFKATSKQLEELFSAYGEVHEVRIMMDKATRRPRGFAFIEMSAKDAQRAIAALNDSEFCGRRLRVNIGSERKPRQDESEA